MSRLFDAMASAYVRAETLHANEAAWAAET